MHSDATDRSPIRFQTIPVARQPLQGDQGVGKSHLAKLVGWHMAKYRLSTKLKQKYKPARLLLWVDCQQVHQLGSHR